LTPASPVGRVPAPTVAKFKTSTSEIDTQITRAFAAGDGRAAFAAAAADVVTRITRQDSLVADAAGHREAYLARGGRISAGGEMSSNCKMKVLATLPPVSSFVGGGCPQQRLLMFDFSIYFFRPPEYRTAPLSFKLGMNADRPPYRQRILRLSHLVSAASVLVAAVEVRPNALYFQVFFIMSADGWSRPCSPRLQP
jgi:hypothetical protein